MEKQVWESDNNIINKNFKYMIDNYYSGFEFKYMWDNNEKIEDYLKRLFISSFIDSESIRYDLPVIIHDIEDFLAVSITEGLFNGSNIDYIYDKLSYNVNSIVYEDNKLSKYDDKTIYLNGDLSKYNKKITDLNLSSVDYRKSYLFFELSKLLIDLETDPSYESFIYHLDKFATDKKITFDNSLVEDGIEMLNVALSQNFAEHVLFRSLDMRRPKYRVILEDNYPVVTNFIDNGLFEKPVISLGQTLSKLNKDNELRTLLNMATTSFETSLLDTIRVEYFKSDARISDLISLFSYFGLLYRN